MLSAIYKSKKKTDTYLYVEKREDFSKVPDELLETFGKPVFVMLINIGNRDFLAGADINKVKEQLKNNGYYLQIPPPIKNQLDVLREQNGIV